MQKYSGCIIEESLKDKSILDAFHILETREDDGISYIVEIEDSKVQEILPKLKNAMVDEPVWYIDLKNYDYHYIIFNDKIFKVDRDYPEQYEETKEYGLKRGIPEEYLPNASWAKDKNITIAKEENIDDIVALRVEMQIEDWNHTLNKDFSGYAQEFARITKRHIAEKLNSSLFFAVLYVDKKAVAMCAIEELYELPQITVCLDKNGRHCCIVSVYTKPAYRGRGYQQQLISYLLDFAKSRNFHDITLTTNTPDAVHIYEKAGFRYISNKYFLNLE